MAVTSLSESGYDRLSELKAFDECKAGVKGLVDAGVSQVPRIFIHPLDQDHLTTCNTKFNFPIIDLQGMNAGSARREEIVNMVREASERWGFFNVVNHGIPDIVVEEMKDGIRRFYEQDTQVKKQYYSRELERKVAYNSNFDLYKAPAANWRDTIYFLLAPHPPHPQEFPEAFRYVHWQ